MERNVRLIIAYDGTQFHGWQRQAGVRTVQEEIERVARRILRHPLHVRGASRTDAGVHARGQVACVTTTSQIPIDNIRRAITHRLPEDVTIVRADEVSPAFHPSLDALRKRYRYRIFNSTRRPVEELLTPYCWHVRYALDLDGIRRAAELLIGKRDFAGFASAGSPRRSTIRNVFSVGIEQRDDQIIIDVEGDGFLYNQVRNMVGTLVEIGRGRWTHERIATILKECDRSLAGPTAPARGLCLEWIRYPDSEETSDGA